MDVKEVVVDGGFAGRGVEIVEDLEGLLDPSGSGEGVDEERGGVG